MAITAATQAWKHRALLGEIQREEIHDKYTEIDLCAGSSIRQPDEGVKSKLIRGGIGAGRYENRLKIDICDSE